MATGSVPLSGYCVRAHGPDRDRVDIVEHYKLDQVAAVVEACPGGHLPGQRVCGHVEPLQRLRGTQRWWNGPVRELFHCASTSSPSAGYT
jgi:hypothetical protein